MYFYDILISGATKVKKDQTLSEVIKKAKELNIKFNPNKLQYCVSKVKFLGFLFSCDGIQPDNKRIKRAV